MTSFTPPTGQAEPQTVLAGIRVHPHGRQQKKSEDSEFINFEFDCYFFNVSKYQLSISSMFGIGVWPSLYD